jgi:TIR domain
MSWLPGFEFDVFISYARIDNSTVDDEPEKSGWVTRFHQHLYVALSKKVGDLNTVAIWRDARRVTGNQLFDKTIQDAVQGSALFIALTSTGYLQSVYCRQELHWFFQKAQQEPFGLAVGDEYRIFNVL